MKTLNDAVIENITGTSIQGWVKCVGKEINSSLLTFAIQDKFYNIFEYRKDISSDNHIGFGFHIKHNFIDLNIYNLQDFNLRIIFGSEQIKLRLSEPLELSVKVNRLKPNLRSQFLKYLSYDIKESFANKANFAVKPSNDTAIITYANDAGAYFPYFYEYYSNIFGCDSIYVITTKRECFNKFDLGGLISLENNAYDDIARSKFVSEFLLAIQTYYRQTIVVDVDEFIVATNSNVDIRETVNNLENNVHRLLGIDVIQSIDEEPLDFGKPILSQRSFGVLNSALCKPSISKIPVVYGVGYHFCDRKAELTYSNELVLLHLKWACKEVRRQVAEIVRNTQYLNHNIAQYSIESVLKEEHPALRNNATPKKVDLSSSAIDEFIKSYNNKLRYDQLTNCYRLEHFHSDYLVNLIG